MLGVRVSEKMQEMIVKKNETLVLLSVSRMKAIYMQSTSLFVWHSLHPCFVFVFFHGILHNKCVYILAEITGFSRNSSPTFIVSNEESPLPDEEVNPNLADKIKVECYY